MITPRKPVPDFTVKKLSGDSWTLSEQKPENFTIIVAYRGYHCPLCNVYLNKLNKIADGLKAKGVNLIVLSSDTKERAEMAKGEWGLDKLDIAYGLSIEDARALGLFVSAGIGITSTGIQEPDLFAEPGLLMVKPDQTLYFADIQTMPFLRPDLSGLLANLDFILAKGYPARGEA
ncbi:MAG: AhpC/TSA family protein [Methylocystaceae bacterium]|nr:AhpC/TSA family protein [Methylocystaceae bacterium]